MTQLTTIVKKTKNNLSRVGIAHLRRNLLSRVENRVLVYCRGSAFARQLSHQTRNSLRKCSTLLILWDNFRGESRRVWHLRHQPDK